MKDFCIVVFSHADTSVKEEILYSSISSIKRLGLKIILASHIPVSVKVQELCDYYIKDDNNIILNEADMFMNPSEVCDDIYTVRDTFEGLEFRTSIFKNTYQAGVINLYIGSFQLAERLGFKNVILWEYDYILGDISSEFIKKSIDRYIKENLDSLTYTSYISGIKCCHAIPSIFNIKRFNNLMPTKYIENAEDYNNLTHFRMCEQFIQSNIVDKIGNRLELDFGEFFINMPDIIRDRISSQTSSHLFYGFRSGIYFNIKCNTVLYFCFNNSKLTINYKMEISKDYTIIKTIERVVHPNEWFFTGIEDDILNCDVHEVLDDLINPIEFRYNIDKNNIDFIKRLKRFVYL